MKVWSTEAETIRKLEERLLPSGVRRSVEDALKLLADEFIEYGWSGGIYDKKQIIEGLQGEDHVKISISDFAVAVLASSVILATYHAVRHESDGRKSYSLRSSIWKFVNGRWQVVFHQGTPTIGEK